MNTNPLRPSSPSSAPSPEGIEAMISRLPETYADWERGMANPDLHRIQRRVIELLRDGEAPSQTGCAAKAK